MNVLHICMFASQKIIRLSSCMCVFFFFFSGTSSIDTTCTIWGLETGQVLGRVNLVSGHVKTQLIAHDKEVSKNSPLRTFNWRAIFCYSAFVYSVAVLE